MALHALLASVFAREAHEGVPMRLAPPRLAQSAIEHVHERGQTAAEQSRRHAMELSEQLARQHARHEPRRLAKGPLVE